MDWDVLPDTVVEFYTLWAGRCSASLPGEQDPAARFAGQRFLVDADRVRTLCVRLGVKAGRYRLPADEFAALTCEANAAQPLRCTTLSAADMAVMNAQAATMLAFTLARRDEVYLPVVEASAELVQVLTAAYMSQDQRRDVVRAIYSEQVRPVLSERERPDPADGPIVSFGTPITAVSRLQQLASLDVADALADVVAEHGWQADIPGHHINPEVSGEGRLQVAREVTSRSALSYASAFVAVDSHMARRGLGYAVAQAESFGAAVLLLPGELEPGGFARVFRDRFAHREEGVYSDVADAQAILRVFLRDHTACITQRHERVLRYRVRLEDLSKKLTRQLATVDLRAVATDALTSAEAQFVASDPIHLGQAHPWELDALARLVGMSADVLKSLVLLDNGRPVQSSPRPTLVAGRGAAPSDARLLGAYAAFAAARQLRAGEPTHWLQLWDEYMEQAVATGTAAKRGRSDAMDWTGAYQRRFG